MHLHLTFLAQSLQNNQGLNPQTVHISYLFVYKKEALNKYRKTIKNTVNCRSIFIVSGTEQ